MRTLTLFILTLLSAIYSYAQAPVARNLSCEVTAGSAGVTYGCTIPGVSSFSYVAGTHYRLKADLANTGPATFNFNGAGALAVTKMTGSVGTALAAGDIRAGQWVEVIYDGTRFQDQSQLGNGGGGTIGPAGPSGPSGTTNNGIFLCQPTSGSGSAYVCTPSPTPTAYANTTLAFVPDVNGAGGSMTVDLGLGPVALKQADCTTNLLLLTANQMYLFPYNGTNFCLASTAGPGGGSSSGSDTCTVVSGTATCALGTAALQKLTMTANTTMAVTGPTDGASYAFDIVNCAGSPCTITWPSSLANAPAMPPGLSYELTFLATYKAATSSFLVFAPTGQSSTPGIDGPSPESVAPATNLCGANTYCTYGDSTLHVPCGVEQGLSATPCMLSLSGGDLSGTPRAVVVSKVNGEPVPVSEAVLGSDSSGGLIHGIVKKVCTMAFGYDNGPSLLTSEYTPQLSECTIATAGTVQLVIIYADSGASTVQAGYRHNGTTTAITPMLTPATISGITDTVACANAAGTAVTIQGNSVTCSTLSNSALTLNDAIETIAGTADSITAKLVITVIWQ